jgi:hypothetical protein
MRCCVGSNSIEDIHHFTIHLTGCFNLVCLIVIVQFVKASKRSLQHKEEVHHDGYSKASN